ATATGATIFMPRSPARPVSWARSITIRTKGPEPSAGASCFVVARRSPATGVGEAVAQLDFGLPAEAAHQACIEQLARHAVGLVGRVAQPPFEADHLADERRELGNAHILAPADIDVALVGVALHQKDQRVGEIVDMEEFAPRLARAPNFNL